MKNQPFSYNPFPLGKLKQEFARPEIEQLRELGYKFHDHRDIVAIFEEKVAKFTGAPYAVAVDCCTHGLFLALRYLLHCVPELGESMIIIPQHTYLSIPQLIQQAGFGYTFGFKDWEGAYQLEPFDIWDAALRWKNGMYQQGTTMVLSFQIKKRIPIGRGGMILTDDKDAADWMRLASYDGRDLKTPYFLPWHLKMEGYHYYMTPEDAARGILLMDKITEEGDTGSWQNYPNLTDYEFFK